METFWNSALEGRSGIRRLTAFDTSSLARECQIGGEIRDFDPTNWMTRPRAMVTARFSQFALAVASMAADDSGIKLSDIAEDKIAVAFGTSMSGLVDMILPEFQSFLRGNGILPSTAREFPGQAATAHVTTDLRARGATTTIASACAAGLDAISWAADRICRGEATVAVAGASETPLAAATLESFRTFGLLSSWSGDPAAACRPFERDRSGLVVSEGAAAVLLEEEDHARRRGARIYARVLGTGRSAEAGAMKVELSGESAARSMELALNGSRLQPFDIDYVSAHGNAVPDHDVAETAALKLALGSHAYRVPASSIRSMCGQAMAASSAIQIVTACLAIRSRSVPPTINLEERDPDCDLDYVANQARVVRVRNVLVHVRSIGGSHASMVLGQVD